MPIRDVSLLGAEIKVGAGIRVRTELLQHIAPHSLRVAQGIDVSLSCCHVSE